MEITKLFLNYCIFLIANKWTFTLHELLGCNIWHDKIWHDRISLFAFYKAFYNKLIL